MFWSRSYQYKCPACGTPYLPRPAFFSLKPAPDAFPCPACHTMIDYTSQKYDYYVYYSRKLCILGTFLYVVFHGFLSGAPMDWADILFLTLAVGVLGGHFAGYVLSLPVGALVEVFSGLWRFTKTERGLSENTGAANSIHEKSGPLGGRPAEGRWAALVRLFRHETRGVSVFFETLRKCWKILKGIAAGLVLYVFLHLIALSIGGLLSGYYIGAHDLSNEAEVRNVASSLPMMIRLFDLLGGVGAGLLCGLMVKGEEILSSVAVAAIVVLSHTAVDFWLDPAGFSLLSHWSEVILFGAIVLGGGLGLRLKGGIR